MSVYALDSNIISSILKDNEIIISHYEQEEGKGLYAETVTNLD